MNRGMMQRVADALNEVAPSLQSLVYSGGASVSNLSWLRTEKKEGRARQQSKPLIT